MSPGPEHEEPPRSGQQGGAVSPSTIKAVPCPRQPNPSSAPKRCAAPEDLRRPTPALASRPRLGHWAKLLGSKAAEEMKETELLADFIRDVFGDVLGYTGPAGGSDRYTLQREKTIEVDGKFADAALGRFATTGEKPECLAAVEGKGPRDPLDRPFAGRKLSAVDQALRYAVNLVCDWYLVTNLRETRLYHKGHEAQVRRVVGVRLLARASERAQPPPGCGQRKPVRALDSIRTHDFRRGRPTGRNSAAYP